MVLADRCTAAEDELLFIAGRLLRRLAESPEPSRSQESLMQS